MTHTKVDFFANLPKEIGSHVELPTWDNDLRSAVETQGFFIEAGTLQTYVMRRDFHDGYLKTA